MEIFVALILIFLLLAVPIHTAKQERKAIEQEEAKIEQQKFSFDELNVEGPHYKRNKNYKKLLPLDLNILYTLKGDNLVTIDEILHNVTNDEILKELLREDEHKSYIHDKIVERIHYLERYEYVTKIVITQGNPSIEAKIQGMDLIDKREYYLLNTYKPEIVNSFLHYNNNAFETQKATTHAQDSSFKEDIDLENNNKENRNENNTITHLYSSRIDDETQTENTGVDVENQTKKLLTNNQDVQINIPMINVLKPPTFDQGIQFDLPNLNISKSLQTSQHLQQDKEVQTSEQMVQMGSPHVSSIPIQKSEMSEFIWQDILNKQKISIADIPLTHSSYVLSEMEPIEESEVSPKVLKQNIAVSKSLQQSPVKLVRDEAFEIMDKEEEKEKEQKSIGMISFSMSQSKMSDFEKIEE